MTEAQAKAEALYVSIMADEADGGLLSRQTIRLANELIRILARGEG
jgi:hypothetical protein